MRSIVDYDVFKKVLTIWVVMLKCVPKVVGFSWGRHQHCNAVLVHMRPKDRTTTHFAFLQVMSSYFSILAILWISIDLWLWLTSHFSTKKFESLSRHKKHFWKEQPVLLIFHCLFSHALHTVAIKSIFDFKITI